MNKDSATAVATQLSSDPSPRYAHTPATRMTEQYRLTSLALGDDPIEALRVFADTLPQLVWITNPAGQAEYFNGQWWNYTGLTYDQSTGEGWTILVHPDDLPRTIERWIESCATGTLYETEYRLRRACDGEYRWFIGRALPFRNSEGQIVAWFGTCTDIHDQKIVQQTLEAAKLQMEQNAKAKDDFLAVLSHELRTPLSAILGWVQLLRMNALDPTEQAEAIATIEEQAKAQSQLVEDLLEVSRIISGKFRMRDESVELHSVINAAVEAVRPLANNRKINLAAHPIDRTIFVRGDAQRLQQVTWNLLTNAVKFTPEGGSICVSLDRVGSQARMRIIDTGCGIEPALLERIFNRFEQADATASRSHGGLGLGLSIVQHIVALHHGTIRAESAGKDRGSTFTVQIPVQAIRPDSGPTDQGFASGNRNALAGKRLLVVDDEANARTVLGTVLRTFGAEVTLAGSAAEALQRLDTEPFDALISDIAMPHQSGFDLIRLVRAEGSCARSIRSVALTAYASVDDQTTALAAGFDRHVTKPVEPMTLLRTLTALIGA